MAADPRHPWSRFNVGSIETLSDRPESFVKLELATGGASAVAGAAPPAVRASVRASHTPALKVRL